MEYLARFDFLWEYTKGSLNVADALSRHPSLAHLVVAVVTRRQAASQGTAAEGTPTPGPKPAVAKQARTPAKGKGSKAPPPRASPVPKPAKRVAPAFAPPAKHAKKAPAEPDAPPDQALLERIRQGYADDEWFSVPGNTARLTQSNGFWLLTVGRRIAIQNGAALRRDIIDRAHAGPLAGHPGYSRTLELVSRYFWWPKMAKDIELRVLACSECQRSKGQTGRTQGKLQPLPIPDMPWESVSTDFIVKLPRTERGFDAVWVLVDRLTKMVHLAPTTASCDAPELARLFFDNVVRLHGPPRSVVSDRGSVFTSKFWESLCKLCDMRRDLTSSYRPQSDGQTERMNRTLADMLRNYVTESPTTWDTYLSAAEFAMNNAVNRSTGRSPFFLNYGFNPALPLWRELEVSVPAARTFVQSFVQRMTDAKACLEAAQQRTAEYYDRNKKDVTFEPGQLVLLNTKHLRKSVKGPRKLLPRWVGPYRIVRMVGTVAAQLHLPPAMRVHHTFHVSLLRLYRTSPDSPENAEPGPVAWLKDEPFYTVESILRYRQRTVGRGRRKRRVREYLVKWLGYSDEHNSWEPEQNFTPDMRPELEIARDQAEVARKRARSSVPTDT